MNKPMSRRSFLKNTAAGAAAAATLSTPASAIATPDDSRQLATLIDISKCIGCEECVYACREVNEKNYPDPQKPFPPMFPERAKVSDWTDKKEVTDRLTPYNWLFIQHATVIKDGEPLDLTIPRRCMHCTNPPCVKLCPFGAAKQFKNGISQIDDKLCLGGAKCKNVCPWHIPERQTGVGIYLDLLPSYAGNGVMYKCDRCFSRIEKNRQPACIEACPEDVQIIGNRREILEKARALARETDGYIYGDTENGGTNTIYVSPVPFEEIEKNISKGPGAPHFKPVKDVMKKANNLAFAMLIAPFAGMAAAYGKFHQSADKDKKGENK